MTELEKAAYDKGYAAGLKDGTAIGYWEGYNEACNDAGIGDDAPTRQQPGGTDGKTE